MVWVLHQCVSRLCVWGWYGCYINVCHGCVCGGGMCVSSCIGCYVCHGCVYVGMMCESGGGVCECKFMV